VTQAKIQLSFKNHSSNRNVLLVEDDAINQFIASKLLTKFGFTVTIAQNGFEAIKKIKEKRFRFVLMDLQMPMMDGKEATKNIRSMPDLYLKTIPIFSFSSAITEKQKAVEMGMTDIAAKPLNVDDLEDKISKYRLNI